MNKYIVKVGHSETLATAIAHKERYFFALQHDPYWHNEPIGTRAYFAEHQRDAFKFRSRAAAEVIAATVGGTVVHLRHKVKP